MMITLDRLFVYPVKSARGIEVRDWPVDDFGLRHDRRFMLVDRDGSFLTQRGHPRLALLRTRIDGESLVLEAPDMPALVTALEPGGGEPAMAMVTVWGDQCAAHFPDPAASAWLSHFLGLDCRLAYLPASTLRRVDPERVPDVRRVSFADAYPFLVIGAASLEDLNARLDVPPLPMNRFRPNLVVTGSAPYAEDSWRRIRVGALELDLLKPCARCAITITDQATGERGVEPLRTLARYRRSGNDVLFGQNALHRGTGVLHAGDPITVLESGRPPDFSART
jgi:uncharacterized protein YcbX